MATRRHQGRSDAPDIFHPPGGYTTILAPPGLPVIAISRDFDACDHLIFEAYTNPRVIPRWFTPEGMDCIRCDVQLHAGGEYRVVNRSRDGVTYGCGGVYLEVRRPHRLTFTQSYDVAPGLESQNTLAISERAARATVEESVLHRTVPNRDAHASSGIGEAVRQAHHRLDRLLQSSMLSLDVMIEAPRRDVFAACTDLNALSIWSAPLGYEVPYYEAYIREGGQWRQMLRSSEGLESVIGGHYLEVANHSRLAFTHSWEPDAEEHSPETVVVMTFESIGGSTEIRLDQGFFETRDALQKQRKMWTSALGRLAQLMRETPTPGVSGSRPG